MNRKDFSAAFQAPPRRGASQPQSGAAPATARLAVPDKPAAKGYGETFGGASFTGDVTLTIPLPEAAVARLGPGLALSYAHGGANGPFGLGMALGLPTIARRIDAGIPTYTDADTFLGPDGQELTPGFDSDGHGGWIPAERTVEEAGVSYQVRQFRARVGGHDARIEHREGSDGSDFWSVRDRDNSLTTYGRGTLSRIADPEAPWRIAAWLPDETVDAHGNRLVFLYKAEDNVGWSGPGFPSPAQRYLSEIQYGNYRPSGGGAEQFAFSLIVDYGDYDPLSGKAAPVRPWPARSDPITAFRTGFPVQILRLCRSVFGVNHLPEAAGPDGPLVDQVLSFAFTDPANAKMSSATLTGQSWSADKALQAASLPALTLDYAPLEPDLAQWQPIAIADAEILPRALDGRLLSFADLHGEGLAGIVFMADATLSYAPPLGDGRYGAIEPLPRVPDDAASYVLKDLNGDGRLSLVAMTAETGGYFYNDEQSGWAPYRPFATYAPEAAGAAAEWVDLDGDGLADLMVSAPDQVRIYRSRGADGFAPPRIMEPSPATRPPETGAEPMLVTYSDMFGDGLQHCVRIRSGRVTVWPNLGHGRFGAPIDWADAPLFGAEIAAGRILLGNVTGGSAADLILAYGDHVLVYPNNGVTGFGAPLRRELPCVLGPSGAILIGDVSGNGHSALIVSEQGILAATWYLDLAGDAYPGLLSRVANGTGGTSTIGYRSSTAFYLADQARGIRWTSRLAMPVILVDRLDHHDATTGITSSEQHQYRDGYFDPVERRFRGFGYVQSLDTRAIDPALWAFPAAEPLRIDGAPIGGAGRLVRSWAYLGAFVSPQAEIAAFRPSFFAGDPAAPPVPPSMLGDPIRSQNADTVRDASAALAGAPIRTETYDVDETGLAAPVPLIVENHAQTVSLIQPHIGTAFASVMLTPRESFTCHYDGVADDPRVGQQAVLEYDTYGNPTLNAAIDYPRRTPQVPAQGAFAMTAARMHFIDQADTDLYLIGVPYAGETYQLAGIVPDGAYFSFDALADGVADALDTVVDYGQPFGAGPQARLFEAERTYYWNGDQSAPAPLGQCSPQALEHHAEDAVFPDSFVAAIYGDKVTPAMLSDEARLVHDGTMWLEPGDIGYFAGADHYHVPAGAQTPFQTDAAHTILAYDPYDLFVVRSTDALGFATTMIPDYQALTPASVTDPNGTTTQGLYDPLQRLFVLSQHAIVKGQWQGGMDLAHYEVKAAPDLAALVLDPAAWLQGANAYFLTVYADTAGSQPSALAAAIANVAPNAPTWSGTDAVPPGLRIGYMDGFGRSLEELERVEAAATPAGGSGWAWLSPVRVDYDHQDRVLRSYIPVYLGDYRFAPAGARAYSAFFYDALDRQVRVDTAKGFITRAAYPNAWTTEAYDADDTVLASPYYRDHINDPNLPPPAKRALEQATRFADTPTCELLDPQGETVRIDEINVDLAGARTTLSTSLARDIAGQVIAAIDPRLAAVAGAYDLLCAYDMMGRAIRVERADSGQEVILRDAAAETLISWTATGYRIRTVYEDLIRRPSRRLVTGPGGGSEIEAATSTYGADPATQTVNRLVRQQDQAGVETIVSYDLAGREAQATRQFAVAVNAPLNWSKPVPLQAESWEQSWLYDASGRSIEEVCADGSAIRRAYFANGWLSDVAVTPVGASVATIVQNGLVYAPAGQPVSALYGDGVALEWTYDPLTDELSHSRASVPSGNSLQDLTYYPDPVGNISTIVDAAAAALMGGAAQPLIKAFTYDGLYRLVAATGWEQAQGAVAWRDYLQALDYDDGGNLVAIEGSAGALAMTVAATSNRAVASAMVGPGHDVDSYFDAAGNLQAFADGTGLGYDPANRLAVVSSSGGAATAYYRYDEQGLRLRKSLGAGDVYHVGAAYIEAGGSAVQTALLVPGAYGDLVFMRIAGQTLQPSYLITDRLQSVTLEVGADGALQRYQDYYPYGGISFETAPAPPALPATFTFAGKELDAETGLNYFGGRYYVSAWGRWLTPDPLGEIDGLNLYDYVGGNPLTASDPTGFARTKQTPRRSARLVRKTAPSWKKTPTVIKVTIRKEVFYGSSKKVGDVNFGGSVMDIIVGTTTGTLTHYIPRPGNTGKGITRAYPMTSVKYRQAATMAVLRRRSTRTMFRRKDKSEMSYVRGHRIPHADTLTSSPLSGGLISTKDAFNYYPEPEGWGEQQRKHREMKARNRTTPVFQYDEYSASSSSVHSGAKVPDRLWFIELTGWSADKKYAGGKKYNIKAYQVDYKTFDYDSLPSKNGSDRRATSSLRVTSLPSHVEQLVRERHGIDVKVAFKF